ncbi:MAG: hypothetical protein OEZ21_04285 [Candidatus Bathyarchaeota archaeon]|nr:hypothetical protein [Candidatus Bathyarchaeota archaeon]MDH5746161.1 hypothetical protein [Candidatus Bathyarchaeota archaeon]
MARFSKNKMVFSTQCRVFLEGACGLESICMEGFPGIITCATDLMESGSDMLIGQRA